MIPFRIPFAFHVCIVGWSQASCLADLYKKLLISILSLFCPVPYPLASWQYFQGRLAGANSTAETLGTNHTSPTDTVNFNNWVTLLSQLPLLLFTLLNSFLYQW